MSSPARWIERGSDGRPYFVKKKSKLPSARELLSDALAPLRRSSLPFSRAYQRDHRIMPVPLSTPHYLPLPSVPPQMPFTPTFPSNSPPPTGQPKVMDSAQYGGYHAKHQYHNKDSNCDAPRGILKPQPTTYPVPHPTMYPCPPQHLLIHQFMPNQHLQLPGSMQHTPTQPPGAYPAQSLPARARMIGPPRYPTNEELKYKCSICGRFRSTRYHYKHPLLPGQLPGKTVCRKCRDRATDSEDSLSSDPPAVHRQGQRTQRGRSRARSRSRSRSHAASLERKWRRVRTKRGRSPSLEEWSEDEYVGEVRDLRRSYSRSSSLDVEPVRSRRHRARSQRPVSPNTEVIRYIERHPQPRPTRRIIYIENERPRREIEYEWDEESEEHNTRPSYRCMGITPSAPPPTTRVIRRRGSDPAVGDRLERYEYLEESNRDFGSHQPIARSRSRATSRARITSAPYQSRQPYTSESDNGFHDDSRRTSYRCPRSLMTRSGSRNDRGRHSVAIIPHAPDPADWTETGDHADRSRSRGRNYRNDNPGSALARHIAKGRPRSQSRSAEHEQLASEFIQPGDEITMIERHVPKPAEYDWYDKDGMRVGVREI